MNSFHTLWIGVDADDDDDNGDDNKCRFTYKLYGNYGGATYENGMYVR